MRGERTLNISIMFVTLDVSKLTSWLKADAPCRVAKEGIRDAGQGAGREGREGVRHSGGAKTACVHTRRLRF